MAAKKGSPAVKTFGEHMVRDHTKNSAALMAAVSKAGMIAATPPLRTDQLSMITELQNLSGAEFDRAYVKQQLQAHQQALALVSTYAKSGDTAPIRAVAQEATPVVQMHLNMLEKMAH